MLRLLIVGMVLAGSVLGQAVPQDFFGDHMNIGPTGYTTLVLLPVITGSGGKGAGTNWPYLETSRGVYNFSNLDSVATFNKTTGKPVFEGYQEQPQWAVSSTLGCFVVSAGITSCPLEPSDLFTTAACQGILTGTTTTNCQFKEFVTTMVQRYKSTGTQTGCTSAAPQCHGVIEMYEAWNEPPFAIGPGGAGTQMPIASFVQLASDWYYTIKANDPNAKVNSPAFEPDASSCPSCATFITTFLNNGGNAIPFDAWDFHANSTTPEGQVAIINAFKAQLVAAGISSSVPLYATEAGRWGDCAASLSTDNEEAYVARIEMLYWANGVKRHYWFSYSTCAPLSNQPTTSTLTPLGIAYGNTETWMIGATMTVPPSNIGTVWTATFTRPGGYQALAVWDTAGSSSYTSASIYSSYKDLSGTQTLIVSNTVTIGPKPLLLESSGLPVLLDLTDRSTVARTGNVVLAGIPMGEFAGFTDVRNLAITTAPAGACAGGVNLDSHRLATERWHGNPDNTALGIKFILVAIATPTLAGSGTAHVCLASRSGVDPGTATTVTVNSSDTCADASACTTVSTGVNKYWIRHDYFNLFDQVRRTSDSHDYITHSASGGIVAVTSAGTFTSATAPTATPGVPGYAISTEQPSGASTANEDGANLWAQVKVSGALWNGTSPKFTYVGRLFFFGGDGSWLYKGTNIFSEDMFATANQPTSVGLYIPTTLGASLTAKFGTVYGTPATTTSVALTNAQKVSGIQYDHGNIVSNSAPTIGGTASAPAPWYLCNDTGAQNLASTMNCPGLNLGGFRIVKGTVTQAVGTQSDGWMGLDDSTNQVNVWVRDNWQTAPNQITADGDTIKVHQWPADGDTLFDGRSTGDLTSITGYKRDMALAGQTGFGQFWPWVPGAAMNMTPQSPNPGRGFFSLVDSSAGGPVVLSGYGANYKFSSSPCAGSSCNFWTACTLSGGKCVYDASKARRVFASTAWTPVNGYLMAMWNGSTTANGLNNWPNLAFFTLAGAPVDVNGTVGTPPVYSSGVSGCATSPAAVVTFIGGGGTGAAGSIQTALGVPTGLVTLTASGTGYTSLPTSGTIGGCTGTATFTGGSLNTPPPNFLGSPGIAKLGTIDPMNTSQMDSFGRSWEVAGNFTSSGSAAPGNDAARWRDTLLFTNPTYFSDTTQVLGPLHRRDTANFPRTEALIDAYFNNLYKRSLIHNLFGIYYGFELYGNSPSGLGGRQIVSLDRRRYSVAYTSQFFRTGDPQFYHRMQSVVTATETEYQHPPQVNVTSAYAGVGLDHVGSASSNVFWDSKHYTDANSNLVAKHDGSPRCTESWGASVWFSTYNASPSALPGGGANVDRCPDGQQPWLDYATTTLKLNYQLSGDPRSKELVASIAKNAIFGASDGTNIRTLTLDEGSGIYSGGAFGRAFGGCMQVATDAAELIGNSVVNYIDMADRCFAANIQDRSGINVWTQNPTGILYDDSAIGPASATPSASGHSHYGSHAFAQTWCYFSCAEYMNYKGNVAIAAPSYATGHASVNIQTAMVKMGKAILGWFDTSTKSGGLYNYLYPGRVAGEGYAISPSTAYLQYINLALNFHSIGAGDQAIASGCGEGGSTTKTGDTPGVPPTPPGSGDCVSPTAVAGNPPFSLTSTTNPNALAPSTPDVHVGGLMALGLPYLEFPLVGQSVAAPLTAPSFVLVPQATDSNAPLTWITHKVGGSSITFHLIARVAVSSDFGNLSIVTPWSGDFTAKAFGPTGAAISGFTLQDSAGHTYTGSPSAVFKSPTQMWPPGVGGGAGVCLVAPAPPSINYTDGVANDKDNRDFLVTIPAAADGDYSFTLTAQGCDDPTYVLASGTPQIPVATVLSPSTGNMDLVTCQQGCGAVSNFMRVETGSSVVANVGTGATKFSGDSSFRFAIVDPSGTLYRGGTTKTVTPNPGCWTIGQNGPWTSESNFILTFGGVGGVKNLASLSCASFYDSPSFGNQTFRPNSIASNPFFMTFLGSGAVTIIRGQVILNGQVKVK